MVVKKMGDEKKTVVAEDNAPIEEAEVVGVVGVAGKGEILDQDGDSIDQASAKVDNAQEQSASAQAAFEGDKEVVSWDAEEYVIREKSTWWYVGLVAVTLLLGGLAVLLQWWTFLAVVVLSALALVVYTSRPPRVLHYALTNRGLVENGQLREYANYKAFGILREGAHFAIMLVPRKRFSPRVTVFFPESQGEMIVDAFGAHLPMEEIQMDMIDKLIKFLRI